MVLDLWFKCSPLRIKKQYRRHNERDSQGVKKRAIKSIAGERVKKEKENEKCVTLV